MAKRIKDENIHDDGTYVVKKNRTANIIALVVCVLIAFAIWVYAKNSEIKKENEEMLALQSQQAQQTVENTAAAEN